jgi:hypothetical protein
VVFEKSKEATTDCNKLVQTYELFKGGDRKFTGLVDAGAVFREGAVCDVIARILVERV